MAPSCCPSNTLQYIPDGSLPNPLPPYRSEQCESLWQLEPAIVSQHARVLYERPKLRGYGFHLVGLAEFQVYVYRVY
jgi:hypothetical protein